MAQLDKFPLLQDRYPLIGHRGEELSTKGLLISRRLYDLLHVQVRGPSTVAEFAHGIQELHYKSYYEKWRLWLLHQEGCASRGTSSQGPSTIPHIFRSKAASVRDEPACSLPDAEQSGSHAGTSGVAVLNGLCPMLQMLLACNDTICGDLLHVVAAHVHVHSWLGFVAVVRLLLQTSFVLVTIWPEELSSCMKVRAQPTNSTACMIP